MVLRARTRRKTTTTLLFVSAMFSALLFGHATNRRAGVIGFSPTIRFDNALARTTPMRTIVVGQINDGAKTAPHSRLFEQNGDDQDESTGAFFFANTRGDDEEDAQDPTIDDPVESMPNAAELAAIAERKARKAQELKDGIISASGKVSDVVSGVFGVVASIPGKVEETAATIMSIPDNVEKKITETKETVEVIKGSVEKTAKDIEGLPATVKEKVTETKEAVEEIKGGVEKTAADIVDIPNKVEKKITETKETIYEIKDGVDRTVEDIRNIPSNVERKVSETKQAIEDITEGVEKTVDDIRSIPSNVERKVEETKQAVEKFKGGLQKMARAVEKVAQNAKSIAKLEKPEPKEPGLADVDSDLDQEVSEALRLAQEAVKRGSK